MSDQYEKLLEEKAKEKEKVPAVRISKTWKVDWEYWKVWPWNWGKNKEET